MDDEMDLDMAQTKEEKDNAEQNKASKTWRILRLSAKTKLAAFEKVEDGKNLKILFESPAAPETTGQPGEDVANDSEATPQATENTVQDSSRLSQERDPAQDSEAPEESVEDPNVIGDAKMEPSGVTAENTNEGTDVAPDAPDEDSKGSLAT
jgi:THO complex subunit 1